MTNPKEVESISQAAVVAAIESATQEVFSTMLALEIAPQPMTKERTIAPAPNSGVVSLIGMAGAWAGTGSLACSGTLACKLSSQFLMAAYDSVNEDVLDAIGEITNMIVGNVKTAFEEKIGPMGLSTPTVIYGRNFQTRSARIHEWTVVPFQLGDEMLYVQVCIAPNPESGSTRPAGYHLPAVMNV